MNEKTTFYELAIGEWFLFNDNLYIKESDRFAIDLIFTTTVYGFGNDNHPTLGIVAFQNGEFVTPVSKEEILYEVRIDCQETYMKKKITFEQISLYDWFIYRDMIYIKTKPNYACSLYLILNPDKNLIWIDETVEVIPVNKNMAVKSIVKEWTAAYERYLKDMG